MKITKEELESNICPGCKFYEDCKKEIISLPKGFIIRYPCGYTEKTTDNERSDVL